MTRILVVEDHALVSEGIQMMLSLMDGIDLVAVASTGEEALELVEREKVELVLMDVNLGPGISGIETTQKMREIVPDLKIMILTMFTDPSTVTQAVKAGANGYLSKGATREDVERAIADVMAGNSVLDPIVTKGIFGRLGDKDATALSQRELQILQELSNGQTTKEIAENVFLSEETVKTYLSQIFKKLGVRDRTEAVAEALRHGIVH